MFVVYTAILEIAMHFLLVKAPQKSVLSFGHCVSERSLRLQNSEISSSDLLSSCKSWMLCSRLNKPKKYLEKTLYFNIINGSF